MRSDVSSKYLASLSLYVCLGLIALVQNAIAQIPGELPRQEYYLARDLFSTGRIVEAAEGFRLSLNRSVQIDQNRWIDSIPTMVMLGECYYEQGSLSMALEQYEAALELAVANSTWIDQLDIADEAPTKLDVSKKDVNWFTSNRKTAPASLPRTVPISFSFSPAPNIPPSMVSTNIDVTEVLRTLGVALRRRGQILGPLTEYSQLSQQLSELLARKPKPRAPWIAYSWSVLRAIHGLSGKVTDDTLVSLRNATSLNNQYDYFMTPMALLVLGQAELKLGNTQAGLPLLQDAAISAAHFDQFPILAETVTRLSAAYTAGHRIDMLPALETIGTWGLKRSASVQAAAFAGAAELAASSRSIAKSETLAKQATGALRSREISLPRIQSQLAYVNSLNSFADNRGAAGWQSLESSLKFMRGTTATGSVTPNILQSQKVIDQLQQDQITVADAESVLSIILREPDAASWEESPIGNLAAMTTSAIPVYAQWLDLAERRGTKEQMIERMDRLLRQRLFESLPMGGRLQSWQQAAEINPLQLPLTVRDQVGKTLQNSTLPALTQQLDTQLEQLRKGPLPLDERQLQLEAKKLFADVTKNIEIRENQLAFLSLQRMPLDRFVPPSSNMSVLQNSLQPGDILLGWVEYDGKLYGTAITKSACEVWSIKEGATIMNQVASLLKEIGLTSGNAQAPSSVTAIDSRWQVTAKQIFAKLFPANIRPMIASAERTIIVPDGQLWYLPFELLPASADEPAGSWLAKHTITYLPTFGFYQNLSSQAAKVDQTVGLWSNLFTNDKAVNDSLIEKLTNGIPGSHKVELGIKSTIPSSLWLRLTTDQMILGSRIQPAASIWETKFLPIDNSQTNQLGNWLEVPAARPSSLIAMGYQSTAVTPTLGNGSELFLPACTSLINGTKATILSRWSGAGRSSQALITRYLQEFPESTPSSAWQRAALSLWAEDFLTAEEPLLLPAGKEAATLTSGFHPKLWSGYMLIGDTQAPVKQQ